jgi:prepilin-type N-terminal cleavage/methylation domain-containing protein
MRENPKGFTLIELMVATVVGGILMASLVSLSGSVQRTFGRTSEAIGLQSKLRFAMKRLVDDVTRAGYMVSGHTRRDRRMLSDTAEVDAALAFAPSQLTMRANYLSSRKYHLRVSPGNRSWGQIVCANGAAYNDTSRCRTPMTMAFAPDPFALPFGIVPGGTGNQSAYNVDRFGMLFPEGALVQVSNKKESQRYETYITSPNSADFSMTFDNPVPFPSDTETLIINPVATVSYSLVRDTNFSSPYNRAKWDLVKTIDIGRPSAMASVIADFMLDPGTTGSSGFTVSRYFDANAGNMNNFSDRPNPVVSISGPTVLNNPVDLNIFTTRALVITLRARTRMEDPDFTIQAYSVTPNAAKNFGVDLDGNPGNGLARVGVERAVIQLRNLSQRFGT